METLLIDTAQKSKSKELPGEVRIFLNHIYELKKGVRNMVLYTVNKRHEEFITQRLTNQNIYFLKQEVDNKKINVFFGKRECIEAIRSFVNKPLNQLSPEEDFILGAMLGYDICMQCERYCRQKERFQ